MIKLAKVPNLKNRGDTIVEVIIVLAVLSLAVTISYTTANRSLLGARQAQENAKATQLLHAQLEALRYLAPSGAAAGSPTDVFQAGPFCITTTGGTYQVAKPAPPLPSPSASCHAVDTYYDISITYQNNPPDYPDTFTLSVSWEDVSGDGQNSVKMNYRVHKPAPTPTTIPKAPIGTPECSDLINNDSDSYIDFPNDPDCTSANDNSEYTPPPSPCVSITGNGDFPAWHLATPDTTFTRQENLFTVKSTGCGTGVTTPLHLDATDPVTLSGADFNITNNAGCRGATLALNATCTITVQFRPPTGRTFNRHDNAKKRTGSLTTKSDAATEASINVSGWTVTDRLAPNETINASPSPPQYALRGWNSSCYNDAFNCHSIFIMFPGLIARYPDDRVNNATWFRVVPGGSSIKMQSDSNLVVYDSSSSPLWASTWEGGPSGTAPTGIWLKIEDGGKLRLMNPAWDSDPEPGQLWGSPGW